MPWHSLVRVVGGVWVVALSACSFSDAGDLFICARPPMGSRRSARGMDAGH